MKALLLLLSVAVFISCSNNTDSTNKNDKTEQTIAEQLVFDNSFLDSLSSDAKDTLLANLATYIIRKPSVATWETKFNNVFRSYYVKNRTELELIYLSQRNDTAFYFLLREARDNTGRHHRGVGGMFVLNSDLSIDKFEETFNTPIQSKEQLIQNGVLLMNHLMSVGNTDDFLDDKSKIEWPDGRLFYSKEKHEWRYVN
jgi:hypothetical protein